MKTASFSGIWRKLEVLSVSFCVFYYTGALFPLLMLGPDDYLDEAERAKLRLLLLPIYVVTLVLLAPHVRQVALAAVRNVPFAVLLALPAMSALWSVSGSLTLRRAFALMMSTLLAILLTVRFTPRQQVLLVGGTYAFCSLASVGMGIAMPGLAYAPGESALRGLFAHKNVLGWVSVITVVFALAMLNDPERRIRLFGWASILAGFLGILESESVTSLLAANLAVVSAFAMQAIARKRGAARLLIQLVILQIAIGALVVLTFNLEPLLLGLGKDPTLTGRIPLWEEVDPWIAKQLVLGYGYGAFWTEGSAAVWQIWEKIGWEAPHAHNGYRDMMLDVGLVGTLVFVFVIFRAMKNGLDLLTEQPGEGWLWCNVMIVVTLFLNLSESSMLTQQLFLTAILTISFRRTAGDAIIPAHKRVALSAV